MRQIAAGVAVLSLFCGCEWIFSPDNLHPNFGGPDGSSPGDGGPGDSGSGTVQDGGADAGAGLDAGTVQTPDAGVICFGPFDAGCARLCITDLTGTFTGQATHAAARGPATGQDLSALAFSYGPQAWIGLVIDGGVVLTSSVTAINRIDALGVSEGHVTPGFPAEACAEAIYLVGTSSEVFTAGRNAGACSNSPFTAPFNGASSLSWIPGPDAGGVVLAAGGVNGGSFEEQRFPELTTWANWLQISNTAAVDQLIGMPEWGYWLVSFQDGTISFYSAPFTIIGGTPQISPTPELPGTAVAQTSWGSGAITSANSGNFYLTLITSNGFTLSTVGGASGYSNPTNPQLTRWKTLDAGVDLMRSTFVRNGQAYFTDWTVTPTLPFYRTFYVGDNCAPPNIAWAAPVPPNLLLTVDGAGNVALTPMPY